MNTRQEKRDTFGIAAFIALIALFVVRASVGHMHNAFVNVFESGVYTTDSLVRVSG